MDILGSTFISLLAMLVTLGILVTIHEYGHFIVARLCGVKVERFSIGFGKPLLRWSGKRGKDTEGEPTEFVISALPLGGYVKMLGEMQGNQEDDQEEELSPAQRKQSFSHKPLIQRTAIVAAGPLANFLLAIVLYWCIFLSGVSGLAPVIGAVEQGSIADQANMQPGDEILRVDGQLTTTWQEVRIALLDRLGETGTIELEVSNPEANAPRTLALAITDWLGSAEEPDLLGTLGFVPFHQVIPPILQEVVAGGRAEAAGLQAGDYLVASNGTPVSSWNMWLDVVRENPETPLAVEVLRNGYTVQTTLIPAVRLAENGEPELAEDGSTQGYIGASVVVPQLPAWMSRTQTFSIFEALPRAFTETLDNSLFVLDSVGKMLTGNISVKNLSGPITIAQVAGETATVGLEYYISFLALLSISLGVLNLLPIPVLDGGHLFYYAIEALIRRPVPRSIQAFGMQVGMMLVGCIMLLALFNDVNRLF